MGRRRSRCAIRNRNFWSCSVLSTRYSLLRSRRARPTRLTRSSVVRASPMPSCWTPHRSLPTARAQLVRSFLEVSSFKFRVQVAACSLNCHYARPVFGREESAFEESTQKQVPRFARDDNSKELSGTRNLKLET